MFFVWNTNRSRGVWRPSPYLQLFGLLLKLAAVLTAIVFVLAFMYQVATGP